MPDRVVVRLTEEAAAARAESPEEDQEGDRDMSRPTRLSARPSVPELFPR